MSAVFDAVNPLERVRLSSQLAASVGTLKAATSPLERVRVTARVAELIRQLGGGSPRAMSPKIRNFGWDAVKLSSLSMEDLRTLREQVEVEHANPFNEKDRYTENGQPTLNLYDKKGSKKLDALSWAVTYKLQEKKAPDSKPALLTNIPTAALKAHVLSMGYQGKGFEVESGYVYLVARHKKTGRGVFVVAGNLDRPTFKAIMAEALAAGIDSTKKLYVFGETATYTGNSIDFMRLDSLPDFKESQPEHHEEPAPEIIEHTTGKGKTLRGIVRSDLSYAEAKAIDPYTWKMPSSGYFIREKHIIA